MRTLRKMLQSGSYMCLDRLYSRLYVASATALGAPCLRCMYTYT